jgi:hypothetical protein
MKTIGSFSISGASFGLRNAQFCVTFAQILRYLYIPALLDIHVLSIYKTILLQKAID